MTNSFASIHYVVLAIRTAHHLLTLLIILEWVPHGLGNYATI